MIDILNDPGWIDDGGATPVWRTLTAEEKGDQNFDFSVKLQGHLDARYGSGAPEPIWFPWRADEDDKVVRYEFSNVDLPNDAHIKVAHKQEVCGTTYGTEQFKTSAARWGWLIEGGIWGRNDSVIDATGGAISGCTFRDMEIIYSDGLQFDSVIDCVFERLWGSASCEQLIRFRGVGQSNRNVIRDCGGIGILETALDLDAGASSNGINRIEGGRFEACKATPIKVAGNCRQIEIRGVYFEKNECPEDISVVAASGKAIHLLEIHRCRFAPLHEAGPPAMGRRIYIDGAIGADIHHNDAIVTDGVLVEDGGNHTNWPRQIRRNKLIHNATTYELALYKNNGNARIDWDEYPVP